MFQIEENPARYEEVEAVAINPPFDGIGLVVDGESRNDDVKQSITRHRPHPGGIGVIEGDPTSRLRSVLKTISGSLQHGRRKIDPHCVRSGKSIEHGRSKDAVSAAQIEDAAHRNPGRNDQPEQRVNLLRGERQRAPHTGEIPTGEVCRLPDCGVHKVAAVLGCSGTEFTRSHRTPDAERRLTQSIERA